MLEAALLRHDRIPRDSLDRGLHGVAFKIGDANSVFVDDRDLAVAEEENVSCVLKNWWNIRGNEKFAVAQTDHNRRSLANGDNRIGLVGIDDRQGEDAAQL